MLPLITTKLQEISQLVGELLDYAERKKTILIERNINELLQLVQAEAKLVKELNLLESERAQLVDGVMQQYPNQTFNEIVEGLDDKRLRASLQGQLHTLQNQMIELQEKNKLNEQLLHDSMAFVQHMIEQVTKSQAQNFNYQPPNSQQKSSNRGFFDTKA